MKSFIRLLALLVALVMLLSLVGFAEEGNGDALEIVGNDGAAEPAPGEAFIIVNDGAEDSVPEATLLAAPEDEELPEEVLPAGNDAEEPEAPQDEGEGGVRSISRESMVIYIGIGTLVQTDWSYPSDIRLTINENDRECDSVVWSSSNESVVTVDQNGTVWETGFGKATITGTLEGTEYQCKVDVREIRMYHDWVYTGEGFATKWMWDNSFCMSVGQSVKYRLEEREYDEKGQMIRKWDVTEKYPLTAENPAYLDVKCGEITALKTGSCQEDGTSGVYYDLVNKSIIRHQKIRFHVFTWTVEECEQYLVVKSEELDSSYDLPVMCFYLTTQYYTGCFPLDDSMFITPTDWHLSRCLPEEFVWQSSDDSILKFTGKQEGSNPDRRYNTAYFEIVGSGSVTISVSYHGTVLATHTLNVVAPEDPTLPEEPEDPEDVVAPKPTEIQFTKKGPLTLALGKKLTLKTNLTPENAETTLTWKSSKWKVATVSEKGVVKAKAKGKTVITVRTANNKTAKITVKVVAPSPTKVKLSKKGTVTLKKGKKLNLKAKLTPANAESKLTWTSSDRQVATVSAKGVVKAKGKGTAVITVKTSNDKTAKVTIKVP